MDSEEGKKEETTNNSINGAKSDSEIRPLSLGEKSLSEEKSSDVAVSEKKEETPNKEIHEVHLKKGHHKEHKEEHNSEEKDRNKEDDTINFNFNWSFLKNKKFQWGLVVVLFAILAILSVGMRLSNLPLLIDHTTGNYTLADPDAMYWLRLEGRLVAGGNISGIDTMRNPGLNVTFTHDLVVYAVVGAYNLLHSFNSAITYQFIDTIYPAYAFLIALAIFFFLIYYLTKSKTASIIGSVFLAYSPAFLFRTVAGVSGHEALGTMFLFAVFLVFIISLKELGKDKIKASIWGVVTGIFITLTYASWNGTANFMFLILPIALFLYYVFNLRNEPNRKVNFILYYIIFLVVSLITTLFVHYAPSYLYSFFFIASGVLVPAILAFSIIDYSFDFFKNKFFVKVEKSKFRLLISAALTLLFGVVILAILKGEGFGIFADLYARLIHPLNQARVALTVAYYAQPYLTDFQSQIMLSFFWLFILGSALILIEFTRNIKSQKERFYLSIIGIASMIAVLFSRYSSTSIFDGVNFLSQFVYFLGFIGLLGSLIFIYLRSKEKIDTNLLFLYSWMIVMLVTIRAAQRTIFLVAPFIAIIGAYLILRSLQGIKNSKKEGMKYVYGIVLALAIVLSFAYMFGNPFSANSPGAYYMSNVQAANTGPLMDNYWQNAMSWVRNNTAPDSIFLSWWDYGYLIQTAGLRTTVLDGGNFNAYWDYMMGRYVLTTPKPDTALSFMKTHNVSYLLIDPTDIGKYPAYSSIGNSENVSDRESYLQTFVSDPSQTQETNNGTTRIYQGGFPLDDDLIINASTGPILLPAGSAGLGAILIHESNSSYYQPQGIYVYNGQQYEEPIEYMYIDGKLLDFHSGVNATVYVYPNVYNNQFDQHGAAMYLSQRTQNSLVAEIYLMNDPRHEYPELKLVQSQGAYPFNFYYGGFQGPLDIWYVNETAITQAGIISQPAFMASSGIYGADDNLAFTKNPQVNLNKSNAPMIPYFNSSLVNQGA